MNYKIIPFILSALFINLGFSQSLDELESKISFLNTEIQTVESVILKWDKTKDSLISQRTQLNNEKNKLQLEIGKKQGIHATVNFMGGNLRENPSIQSKIILKIPGGAEILVFDFFDPFFKVTYLSNVGYLSLASIESNENMDKIKKEISDEEMEMIKKANPQFASWIRDHGKYKATMMLAKKHWKGMTKTQAQQTFGRPENDNESNGSWGLHNQWVYDNMNLYFEDGILRSWQLSN